MAVFTPALIILAAAALASAIVLIVALRQPRLRPTRRWAWIVGVVIACAGTAFHLVISVATVIQAGGVTWLQLGTLALLCTTALAFVQPRWAAWLFAATAIVIPIALTAVDMIGPPPEAEALPGAVVVGFYSVRALVTAAFLGVATLPPRVRG